MTNGGKNFSQTWRLVTGLENAARSVVRRSGVWLMPQSGRKFGKVKVKRIKADLADIPENCGYDKRFKFDIDMNSNGISGECIEWCQVNCKHKWGWWFEGPEQNNPYDHRWQEQNSYMSFENKKEATAFWLAIGIQNMNNKEG